MPGAGDELVTLVTADMRVSPRWTHQTCGGGGSDFMFLVFICGGWCVGADVWKTTSPLRRRWVGWNLQFSVFALKRHHTYMSINNLCGHTHTHTALVYLNLRFTHFRWAFNGDRCRKLYRFWSETSWNLAVYKLDAWHTPHLHSHEWMKTLLQSVSGGKNAGDQTSRTKNSFIRCETEKKTSSPSSSSSVLLVFSLFNSLASFIETRDVLTRLQRCD